MSSVTKVTFRSNSDQKMASFFDRSFVLDDDSDDFGLSEDESSEGEDEGISVNKVKAINPLTKV